VFDADEHAATKYPEHAVQPYFAPPPSQYDPEGHSWQLSAASMYQPDPLDRVLTMQFETPHICPLQLNPTATESQATIKTHRKNNIILLLYCRHI
jgi:hypothetical protein